MRLNKKFRSGASQLGVSMVELSLLIVLIALVALPSVRGVGRKTKCQNYRYSFTLKVAQSGTNPFFMNGVWWIQETGNAMQEVKDSFDYICAEGDSDAVDLLNTLW